MLWFPRLTGQSVDIASCAINFCMKDLRNSYKQCINTSTDSNIVGIYQANFKCLMLSSNICYIDQEVN